MGGFGVGHSVCAYLCALSGGRNSHTRIFLVLNPNGQIPVIEDLRPEGKVVVSESMACAANAALAFKRRSTSAGFATR
jgi:glutathione S-transferase